MLNINNIMLILFVNERNKTCLLDKFFILNNKIAISHSKRLVNGPENATIAPFNGVVIEIET